MYVDAITADFIVSFIAVILTVLLIFPTIDLLNGWVARRSLPQDPQSRDRSSKETKRGSDCPN